MAAQVRLRATRLGLVEGPVGERIRVVAESSIDRIVDLALAERPALLIVDSVQTATVDDLDGAAGSVGQVREAALRLMELAKSGDSEAAAIAVVLVGHVTKEGSLAGPKTLEHLVDAVIGLEGERFSTLRLLRATKNRFGSTEEVGVLEMGERGLAPFADPARAFITEHDGQPRAALSRRPLRAPGRSSSRSRRSPRRRPMGPLDGPPAGSTRTAWHCLSRSSAGGPGSAWAATTCTPTWPAA